MPDFPHERPQAAARLLLIDGDDLARRQLAAGLGIAFAATTLCRVANGRQAAEALRADAYDVVLIDLGCIADLAPVQTEAVARLVKLAAGALVVALSDGRSISAAVEVMRAGAHDCVARPVEAPMLAVRIAELARRHGRSRMLPEGSVLPANIATLPRHAAHRPAVLPMWQQEQRIIEEAIASFSGNIALAAAALELSPSTIYRKRQTWAETEGKRGAA